MLHIILFILKMIGWILLAILALLVLIVCVALFTPLRYQADGICKGKLSTLEAGIHFHVLFHLVSGSIQYKDGKLLWNIRAAWIRLGSETEKEAVTEEVTERIEYRPDTEDDIKQDTKENQKSVQSEAEEDQEQILIAAEEKIEAENPSQKQDGAEEKENPKMGSGITEKVSAFFEKIKYTFSNICDKIKVLLKKKEIVMTFLTDEVHQQACFKMLSELKKMVRRMLPKCITGELRFGFEDPSLTGKIFAGISMLYPVLGDQAFFYPDFEEKVLDGSLTIKGSARILPAVVFAWNMLLDRNVRKTIRDIRKFSF